VNIVLCRWVVFGRLLYGSVAFVLVVLVRCGSRSFVWIGVEEFRYAIESMFVDEKGLEARWATK
jgi:hypothetical protein